MNTMKALHRISFPQITKPTETERHFNAVNNERLNENFYAIAASTYEIENILDLTVDYIAEQGISGSWYYVKLSSGIVMAWLITTVLSEVISSAAGSLYKSEQSYAIPEGLVASVEDVSISVQCATPVWATVKAISVSSLDIYFLATASATYDVMAYARIIGRV